MSVRDDFAALPEQTAHLRAVRYLPDTAIDELSAEDIERAERWLRAAAYSCTEGARRLRRYQLARNQPCPDSASLTPARTKPTTSPSGSTPNEPSSS